MSRFFATALGGARMAFYVAVMSIVFSIFCVIFATARYYWVVALLLKDDFKEGKQCAQNLLLRLTLDFVQTSSGQGFSVHSPSY